MAHWSEIERDAPRLDWPGDAKLAGTLVRLPAPALESDADSGSFRLDVTEVVHVSVDRAAGRLVVESWHPGRGLERIER